MRNYYNLVKQALVENPEARDDDMLLYAMIIAKSDMVKPYEAFYYVLQSAKERKLPSYESVTRARRKVQEQEPELRGTMRRRRLQEEEEYHDYYSTH